MKETETPPGAGGTREARRPARAVIRVGTTAPSPRAARGEVGKEGPVRHGSGPQPPLPPPEGGPHLSLRTQCHAPPHTATPKGPSADRPVSLQSTLLSAQRRLRFFPAAAGCLDCFPQRRGSPARCRRPAGIPSGPGSDWHRRLLATCRMAGPSPAATRSKVKLGSVGEAQTPSRARNGPRSAVRTCGPCPRGPVWAAVGPGGSGEGWRRRGERPGGGGSPGPAARKLPETRRPHGAVAPGRASRAAWSLFNAPSQYLPLAANTETAASDHAARAAANTETVHLARGGTGGRPEPEPAPRRTRCGRPGGGGGGPRRAPGGDGPARSGPAERTGYQNK